jgi:hypothetical protein
MNYFEKSDENPMPRPNPRAKSEVIIARIDAEDRKMVEEAARANHQTLSEWLRSMIHAAISDRGPRREQFSSWHNAEQSESTS